MENTMVSDTDTFENFLLETGTEVPVLAVEAIDVGEIEKHLIHRSDD